MRTKTLPRKRTTLRVAIYLRVSTAKQLEGFGLDDQSERCRAWVAYQLRHVQYTIVDTYCDGGVSGKITHREDVDRLMDDIRAGLIDVVVFGKLDRIGRTMRDIHRWVYDATDFGVRVATADGRIDSEDQMFGIQLSLLAYMAEVEHALILERTMGGRIKKVAGGGWASGTPPYGYMLDDDGEPVVNPAEQKVIIKATEYLVDDKMTRGEAASALNTTFRTRTGKLWEGNNLILRLRLAVRGYVDFTFAGVNEDGEEIATSYRLELPPLFESEERRKALEDALSGMKGNARTHYSTHLLSGHLFSVCGHGRHGVHRHDTGDLAYLCSNPATAAEGHGCKPIPGNDVEELVWDEVAKLLGDPEAIVGMVDHWLGSVPERADSYRARSQEIDRALSALRATRRKKIALLAAAFDGDDDRDMELIAELKEEIAAKETKLREEQERIAEWLEEVEDKERRADAMRTAIDQVRANVAGLGLADKKRILSLLRVRVDVIGDADAVRSGGSKDPMTEWHRENGIDIPTSLTDGQWQRIESILEGGVKPRREDRACFEMLLEKIRGGKSWHDYNGDERMGGKGWAFFYRTARRWFEGGLYALALVALSPYEGVPAPADYTLPPMKISGEIDDSPEGVVKPGTRGAITSTKGITGDSALRGAA